PDEDGYGFAVYLFFKFITSAQFNRLARCARCQQYYLMHRLQSGRRYCSAKCGRSETSAKAVRDLNATLLAAKLRACNVAIRALPPRDRMKSNWKQKVA